MSFTPTEYNKDAINAFDIKSYNIYYYDNNGEHLTKEYKNLKFKIGEGLTAVQNEIYNTTTTTISITKDLKSLVAINLQLDYTDRTPLFISILLKNGMVLIYDITSVLPKNTPANSLTIDLSATLSVFRTFIEPWYNDFWYTASFVYTHAPLDLLYFVLMYASAGNEWFNSTGGGWTNSSTFALLNKDNKYVKDFPFSRIQIEQREQAIPKNEIAGFNPVLTEWLEFQDNAIDIKQGGIITNLYAIIQENEKIKYFPLHTSGNRIVRHYTNGNTAIHTNNTLSAFIDALKNNTDLSNGFIGLFQLDNVIIAKNKFIDSSTYGSVNLVYYWNRINDYFFPVPTTPQLEYGTFISGINASGGQATRWDKKYLKVNNNDTPLTISERQLAFYVLLDKIYLVRYSGGETGFKIIDTIEPIEIQNIDRIKQLQLNNVSFQNSITNAKINNNFEKQQINASINKNNVDFGIDTFSNITRGLAVSSPTALIGGLFNGFKEQQDFITDTAKGINEYSYKQLNLGIGIQQSNNQVSQVIRDNEVAKNTINANTAFSYRNSIDKVIDSFTQHILFNFSNVETWNGNEDALNSIREFHLLNGVDISAQGFLTSQDSTDNFVENNNIFGVILEKATYNNETGAITWVQIYKNELNYFYFLNWAYAFNKFKNYWLQNSPQTLAYHIFKIFEQDIALIIQNGFTYVNTGSAKDLLTGITHYRVRKEGEVIENA